MDAEDSKTRVVFYDDKSRFEAFIQQIPEQWVDGLNWSLEQALLPRSHSVVINGYLEQAGRIDLQFNDVEIEGLRKKFNSCLKNLNNFLVLNFGVSNTSPDIFDLYPNLRYSNDPAESNLWREKFEELEKILELFNQAHEEFVNFTYRRLSGTENQEKISLEQAAIEFNDEIGAIIINGLKCNLPPFQNEHCLARAIFGYKKGQPVDWSFIYEKMTGDFPANSPHLGDSKMKRTVNDTVRRLNERIQRTINTEDLLIDQKGKTIIRNF